MEMAKKYLNHVTDNITSKSPINSPHDKINFESKINEFLAKHYEKEDRKNKAYMILGFLASNNLLVEIKYKGDTHYIIKQNWEDLLNPPWHVRYPWAYPFIASTIMTFIGWVANQLISLDLT